MAIAFDSGSGNNWANAGTATYSVSVTVPTLSEPFMAIFVSSDRAGQDVLSATIGGNSMTAFTASMTNAQSEEKTRGFYIVGTGNLVAGSRTLAVTFTAATANNPCVLWGFWDGVDQSTPVSDALMTDCSSGGNTTTLTRTLSSASGDVAIAIAHRGFPLGANPAFTPGTDVTTDHNSDFNTGVKRSMTIFSKSGGNVTINGTQDSSRAQMVSFSLLAAAAGATGVPATNRLLMGVG